MTVKSPFQIGVISQTFDDPDRGNLERSDQITTVEMGIVPDICEITPIILNTNDIMRTLQYSKLVNYDLKHSCPTLSNSVPQIPYVANGTLTSAELSARVTTVLLWRLN